MPVIQILLQEPLLTTRPPWDPQQIITNLSDRGVASGLMDAGIQLASEA